MSGLVITVGAETAKDEDRICKEQEGRDFFLGASSPLCVE
jgi:hypothetical protein